MSDKISVIIPFYNGKKWLREALESVLRQTIKPYEIIVINDGSFENIDDLSILYKKEVRFITQENKGAASARNKGIKASTGDYIAFLDSDDLWLPDKLNVQLNYMKENKLNWSHSPYKVFDDESHTILKEIDNTDVSGMIYPRSLARCNIATPCVMIRKDCLIDTRMRFNEKMRQGQDYCFWNVLARKYKLGNVGVPLVLVRNHGSNLSQNVFAQIKSRSMMYEYLIENQAYFGSLPVSLKIAFNISRAGHHFVSGINNNTLKNIVASVVYAIPYIIFHLYYKTCCQ